MIEAIGLGALAGLFVAGAGYFKSNSYQEGFDVVKFLKTIILGGIIGGAVPATGLTENTIVLLLTNIGAVAFIENVLKGLFRRSELVQKFVENIVPSIK